MGGQFVQEEQIQRQVGGDVPSRGAAVGLVDSVRRASWSGLQALSGTLSPGSHLLI